MSSLAQQTTTDASELSARYLKEIARTDKKRFDRLCFSQVALPIIDDLFPKFYKNGGRGQLDPPYLYKKYAKNIREWRRLGNKQQHQVLEKRQEQTETSTSTTTSNTKNTTSTENITSMTVPSSPQKNRYSKRVAKKSPEDKDKPQNKRLTTSTPFPVLRASITPRTASTTPPSMMPPTFEEEDDVESVQEMQPIQFTCKPPPSVSEKPAAKIIDPSCRGICLQYVRNHARTDPDITEKGFCHLVGAAYHEHGSALSQQRDWPHDPRFYCGALNAANSKELLWLLQLKTTVCDLPTDFADNYIFRTPTCKLLEATLSGVCKSCRESTKYFFRKCRYSANLYALKKNLNSHTTFSVLTSPTLLRQKLESNQRVRRTLLQKTYRLQIQKKMRKHTEQHGIDLDPIAINHHDLFGDETKHLVDNFIKNHDELLEEKDVIKFLFDECQLQGQQAQRSGKKTCRYSPLMIRFATCIRLSTGKSTYNFMSKVFSLPSDRTIDAYTSPSSTAPDGPLWETLQQQKELFTNTHANSNLTKLDFRRHGFLGFDSMKLKEGIEFDANTNRIVGFANDAFDSNVIKKSLEKLVKQMTSSSSDDTSSSQLPERAEHYLVFIFTTASKDNRRFQFVAARYAVKGLESNYIRERLLQILAALYGSGFIVIKSGGDGASENRRAFNLLFTVTLRDCLEKYNPVMWTREKDNADDALGVNFGAMLDEKIGFEHPCNPNLIVFGDNDMPHGVKKFVNALERSGLQQHHTDLRVRGQKVSLKMLEDIWRLSGDDLADGGLRISPLGVDHFEKNSNNRMRAFLAFQITSQSMIGLIDGFSSQIEDGEKRYRGLRELLHTFDCFIDIMNATRMNRNKAKYCEPIQSPDHKHIYELLNIAHILQCWKEEFNEKELRSNFIPLSTYQDLIICCLGTVGGAWQYLNHREDRIIDQARCGSDCCEHHFANLRMKNQNPTARMCQQLTAKATAFRSNDFKFGAKTNTAGKSGVFASEVFAPIPRKNIKKK